MLGIETNKAERLGRALPAREEPAVDDVGDDDAPALAVFNNAVDKSANAYRPGR